MNWVFENNFRAGFTPFSSLLVFKDFAFCLYGDVLRDGIHNDDLQRNRSLQHCCGFVSNYMSPNLAELKIVVVNPVE